METKTNKHSEESKKFKQIRIDLNLTQVEMASKLLVKQGTISDIERSRIGVSKKITQKLKTLLNIDFDSNTKSTSAYNYCPHCGKSLK